MGHPNITAGTLYDFEPISFSSNNQMEAAIAIVNGNDVSGSTPTTAGYGAACGLPERDPWLFSR